jgi:GntR family transcriptional repressor for pyruvate dehydrogenase complex
MKKSIKSPFTKVAPPSFTKKSSLIAEQILQSIKNGSYPPGSKLPAERLIAEQMDVGRPAVREAISALQISGVLESRPGDGTYVAASLPPEVTGETGIAVLEESDSPFEALQVRKAMEIGVVYLAVHNASAKDIRRIKRVWSQKRKMALSGNLRGFIEHGRDFHLAIAEATGSRSIVSLTEGLLRMTHQSLWVNMRERYYRQDAARLEPMIRLHDEIVRAIEHRDSAKAIRLVEEHYDIQIDQHYTEPLDRADAKGSGRVTHLKGRPPIDRPRETIHR